MSAYSRSPLRALVLGVHPLVIKLGQHSMQAKLEWQLHMNGNSCTGSLRCEVRCALAAGRSDDDG